MTEAKLVTKYIERIDSWDVQLRDGSFIALIVPNPRGYGLQWGYGFRVHYMEFATFVDAKAWVAANEDQLIRER